MCLFCVEVELARSATKINSMAPVFASDMEMVAVDLAVKAEATREGKNYGYR